MKTKAQINLRIAQLRHQAEDLRLQWQELLLENKPKNKARREALLDSWNITLFQVESLMWVVEQEPKKKGK
ncbi:hypothetical protein [Spirosoma luteum]|uniref:hypothetical protein n=1 Tax=Spirosoma luteum TaxID=431553 RepID=UPI0003745F85|nr:hypothetical protein [Spirosoma luteum]